MREFAKHKKHPDVKRDCRSKGYYFDRMPRIGAKKCKQFAFKDISKECKNYISREWQIMRLHEIDVTLFSIQGDKLINY